MNIRQTLSLASVLALFTAATGAPATLPVKRTLTDTSGRKLEVTVLTQAGDLLHVRRESDDKEFDVPFKNLSQDDQKFAKELQDAATAAAVKPPIRTQPSPSTPPTRQIPNQKPPQGLLENIPTLESQFAELTSIADQFANDPKRTRDADTLRDRIVKATNGSSDALADLSWLIREIRCTRGFPEGAQRSFDILRLALVEETPKALDHLFRSYDLNDAISRDYTDECYVITKRHADNCDITAMIALGSCWINGHGSSPIASAELRSQNPNDPKCTVRTGIEWLEKALAAEPTPGQKSWINNILAKAYKYNDQPEKALPLLTDGANLGNPYLMQHLADMLYDGKGCDRNLPKAVEWYEKAAAKGVNYGRLEFARNELKYGCGSITATFVGAEFPLRVFGRAESKHAVVIFGSSGFSCNTVCAELAVFQQVFDAGWNLVIYDYPQVGPFTKVQPYIVDWMAPQTGNKTSPPTPLEFTGFAEAVVSTLKSSGHYEQFLLVGNSLGTGAMAWDLQTLQKDKQIHALWISPTEMFIPLAQLKSMGGIEVIAMPDQDPFVRNSQLKDWIQAHAVPEEAIGKLPEGHLILGENLPYKNLADYLAKRLR